jgi:hypothetical protein
MHVQALSLSFQMRQKSCFFDNGGGGYWTHPGYFFLGGWTVAAAPKWPSLIVLSAGDCASACTSTSDCGAFAFFPASGDGSGSGCQLLNGTESGVCDPQSMGCSTTATMAAAVADSGGSIYVRDALGMYCRGSAAETCACLREYADCMRRRGCQLNGWASAGPAYLPKRFMGAGTGSTAQLHPVIDVNLDVSDPMRWDANAGPAAWWEELGGWDGWGGLVGLCAGSGCTAAQCGLPGPVCNRTANACKLAFLSCTLTESVTIQGHDKCQCLKSLVICLQDAACLRDGAYGANRSIDLLYSMCVAP